MTLKEAEEYFKRFDGHPFHMGREEPEMYREFCDMDIPEATKEQWRQELIDSLLKELSEKKEGFIVYRILEIICESKTGIADIYKNKKADNISLLLDTIDSLKDVDSFEKILIIENLTKHCGIIVVNGLGERLNNTFERLSDIPMTEEEKSERLNMYWSLGERYESAVRKYRESYEYYAEKTN